MFLDCPAEQCDYTADATTAARRPGDKRAVAEADDGLVSYKHMHYECLIDSRGRPPLCRTVSLSAFWPRHTFKGLVARIVIYPLSPRPNKSMAQEIS